MISKRLLILGAILGTLGQAQTIQVPTTQTISLPLAGAQQTQPGLIVPTDWAKFNGMQPLLGFTPENPLNKNAHNGYAGLDANGLYPWAKLSGIPVATSATAGILQAADWVKFNAAVNGAQAAAAAPVQSVNGQVGRIAGLLQVSNNLADISSATIALGNLGLTGSTPATISANTTGNAATANALRGTGPFSVVGLVGTLLRPAAGQMAMGFDSATTSFHVLDANGNTAAPVVILANGASTNCLAGQFVTGFSTSGMPQCAAPPVPPAPPSLDVPTPATSSSPCTPPQRSIDPNYAYYCTLADTWARVPLTVVWP